MRRERACNTAQHLQKTGIPLAENRNWRCINPEFAVAAQLKIWYNTRTMIEKNYINRSLEKVLAEAADTFKVVMVGGARQVGKTTLMRHFLATRGEVGMLSLDNPDLRNVAKQDPELLLSQYPAPLLIDEFQYAPELLPFIKTIVDEHDASGQYFLTGSQLFKMMASVGESLAGRIAVLSLSSFSQAEILGKVLQAQPFKPAERYPNIQPMNLELAQDAVFRGGMPALTRDGARMNRELFFSSYVQTYIERDIREIVNVRNVSRFADFLACVAARTGEELVCEDIASAVGVDAKTVKSWIGVLEATGIVFLLRPWSGNATKRIVKRPKLHFMDTGLAAHLARIPDRKTLFASRQAGHFFESWVVGQIVRSYQSAGLDPSHYLYFYRDDARREIDMLVSMDGKLYPVEIKMAANPGMDSMKSFSAIDETGIERGPGCVLSLSRNVIPVRDKGNIVNVSAIWEA